jgi:trans-2,3-dihydro-3-hydroxyanthranilate isomerase
MCQAAGSHYRDAARGFTMRMSSSLSYVHVDVFSAVPYGGNPLPVFLDGGALSNNQMLAITRELRQFETIFLERTEHPTKVRARVFDLIEELPFAGHPLLGAAATLHAEARVTDPQDWTLLLGDRQVSVRTRCTDTGFESVMDQGEPSFVTEVGDRQSLAHAFSLSTADLDSQLPMEVVSTGLAYLIVPVRSDALHRARIRQDISVLLSSFGAQYAVLLDEASLEIRHWSNDGMIEDVATGSAAGTVGAYRLKQRRASGGEEFTIQQGRFAGRPSQLRVTAHGTPQFVRGVSVGGPVVVIGRGQMERLP